MNRSTPLSFMVYALILVCALVVAMAPVALATTNPSAAGTAEAQEVARILRDLEDRLSTLETQILSGAATPRAPQCELSEIADLLDFLEREAKQFLAGDGALQERVSKLHEWMTRLLQRVANGTSEQSNPCTESQDAQRAYATPMMRDPSQARSIANAQLAIAPPPSIPSQSASFNREAYAHLDENPFVAVGDDPLSTFSVDVDTASYSNLRQMLSEGRAEIPKGAVRIEELINYFRYDYLKPGKGQPLAMYVETTACPWAPEHRLARVALQAHALDLDERRPSNLVFLIDTSGSMNGDDRLGLLREAYNLLIDNLDERDRVAIVTYAGSAGLVLPSTTANNPITLKFALEKLNAGGATAGGAGIKLAYQTAREHFIEDGNNRVIMATDGDFNVGVSSESELVSLIQEEARSGVFLTVLGFGSGNYQDAQMESLSNHGNGNYAYIDGMPEARKVFLNDLLGTLYTVAKDVKFQIEFNPAYVRSYRLIGYENRQLADRDFADDRKDAGDVGSGHQVTALYELVPSGSEPDAPDNGMLRYQQPRTSIDKAELMHIKLRFKEPKEDRSSEVAWDVPVPDNWRAMDFSDASSDTRFAAAVAAFGMILRDSEHKGDATLDWIYKTALNALGQDSGGHRSGFIEMVRQARSR